MKTERRHELQTNELADWLGEHATAIQPYLKTIAGVAILALVGFLALFVMKGQQEGRSEAAWTNFFEAQSMGDADAAKEVARQFPRTEAAAWAWQWAGDYELAQASSDAFVDRAESHEGLLQAKDAYESAMASNPPALIRQRSMLGLAQVHEALNDLDEAQECYQELADTWPDSHAATKALDRIAFLQTPETRDFSNWFAKQKPRQRTATTQTPSGITPPTASDDLTDESDMSLPDESALKSARSSTDFDRMTPPEAQPEADSEPLNLDLEPPSASDDEPKAKEEPSIYGEPAMRNPVRQGPDDGRPEDGGAEDDAATEEESETDDEEAEQPEG